MQIREDFILRQVADTWVVLPIGQATVDFNGMITLNSTGVFLWHLMEQGTTRDEMAEALVQEYGIDLKNAVADVNDFITSLSPVGCILE